MAYEKVEFNKYDTLTAEQMNLIQDALVQTESDVEGIKETQSGLQEQVAGGVKIEVVSYVGTETYGSSNPCSITFSFAPKVIMILYDRYLGTNIALDPSRGLSRVVMDEITTSYEGRFGFGDGSNSYGKKSADGKTFFWYNNSAPNQYNAYNTKYYVLAIG